MDWSIDIMQMRSLFCLKSLLSKKRRLDNFCFVNKTNNSQYDRRRCNRFHLRCNTWQIFGEFRYLKWHLFNLLTSSVEQVQNSNQWKLRLNQQFFLLRFFQRQWSLVIGYWSTGFYVCFRMFLIFCRVIILTLLNFKRMVWFIV